MQNNLLLNELCDIIDKITKILIWGRSRVTSKWEIVKWTLITSPRKFIGFVIRDVENTILALENWCRACYMIRINYGCAC